jgi:hypothetical protein
MRFALALFLVSGFMPVAFAQNTLSPARPDTVDYLPTLPASVLTDDDEQDADDGVSVDVRNSKQKTERTTPCCEKKPFRLTPRHTWDVNVDGSFLLPRFVSVVNPNFYGYSSGFRLFAGGGVVEPGSATLMVRRNVTSRKPGTMRVRKGAYRYGLTVGMSLLKSNPDTVSDPNGLLAAYGVIIANYYTLVGGRFGFERQETVGRFQFIYGYEVGAAHYWRNDRLQTTYLLEKKLEETNFWTRTHSVSAAALGGVRYYLHPRFSVAIEARYHVQYDWSRWGGLYPAIYQGQNRIGSGSTWRLSNDLIPLSALYIAFHLGKKVQVN